MPVQTPLPTNYLKNNETDSPKDREQSGNSEPFHCRNIATGRSALFITDDELRAAGVSELDIDALDRNLPTQKNYSGNRDRAAVEEALRTRRSGK